jgi:hypothetical protein
MLTAAVRDLHLAHPRKFATDVRTACGALWENNPYITGLSEDDPEVECIDCEYPLIHESNDHAVHFIHGFVDDLQQKLGVPIKTTLFKGDIHLAPGEKNWGLHFGEITSRSLPFWIIVAGGKTDFTVKWWDARRWQRVVDHFRDRILFVQVGEAHHSHPELNGVVDLRGKTDLRQLVRLVYHSQGVVCPVTLLMHLATAVELKGKEPKNRPCVVVAGGREPVQWEAYPHHQFIHTNGALLCCDQGGCWKSRTVPLGDGDPKDEDLCIDVVVSPSGDERPEVPLPRCMDLISAEEVIRRIQLYFDGGTARFLTANQARSARTVLEKQKAIRLKVSEEVKEVARSGAATNKYGKVFEKEITSRSEDVAPVEW